jgi:dTDP-4-amino-4,6-dideoxygalactose transaminase
MQPPRIPLSEPDLRGREAEYLRECVRDNWVSSAGPHVAEFERRVAALAGRRFAVATVNGTSAIHLALLSLGITRSQRVVVPDWTFAATVNAVCHAGAAPVFIDVTEESWSLDPALLSRVLRGRADIAAIIAVDAIGHPADFDAIAEICRRHGLPLIEDAAGAIGASYRGRPCGGLGDIGIFSFNGNKTVTAGGGGMLVTDDQAVAHRARSLSAQARPGRDYIRMTNLNAAVGLAQLERLDEMVAAKRAIAARYDAALASRDDIVPMPRCQWAQSSCWLYSVKVASEQAASQLVRKLEEDAIEARIFWRSLSAQAPWRDTERHLTGVSASLSGTVISLPCSSHLSEAQQMRVIRALEREKVEPSVVQ